MRNPQYGTCPECGEDWDRGNGSMPPFNNCTCEGEPTPEDEADHFGDVRES